MTIKIRMEVLGDQDFKDNINILEDKMKNRFQRAINQAASNILGEVKGLLSANDNKDGKNPSGEGQPPARVSSTLLNSINFETASDGLSAKVIQSSSIASYGKYLESPRKLNRPFMKTASENQKDQTRQLVRDAINDAL